MNKILITGGAGFIGSSLVEALLLSKKHYVIVFDNFSTGNRDNVKRWLAHPHFLLINGDMLDVLHLKRIVRTCDIVCHLSANSIVALGETDTKIDYNQNLTATYNLLESMRESPYCKKIMFLSTSTVYGESGLTPIDEKHSPMKPISLYGASKLACEALISGYCHMFNMTSIVVRLANVIGPHNTHGVIYDFITKLDANSTYLDILGNGKQNKSYLHIDDCITGLVTLLERLGSMKFEIFNMGSDDTITVSEIADIVSDELSLGNIEKRFIDKFQGRGWNGDIKEYLLDSSKMKSIGWKAQSGSKAAVIKSVRDYLNRKIPP